MRFDCTETPRKWRKTLDSHDFEASLDPDMLLVTRRAGVVVEFGNMLAAHGLFLVEIFCEHEGQPITHCHHIAIVEMAVV
jgi:hypothetical protein